MSEQPKYTIYATWNDKSHRQGKLCFFPLLRGEVEDLDGRIEYVRNYHGPDSFVPIAWCESATSLNGFEGNYAESLAAGRTIELVDGKYIPRGLPVEAEGQRIADADATAEQIMDALADLHFAAIADANAAMIARDGPAKPRCTCGDTITGGSLVVHRTDGPCYYEEPKSTALPANPALQRMSDTGSHQFGSMKR